MSKRNLLRPLEALGRQRSDAFDLFTLEALRALGAPVPELDLAEEDRSPVSDATGAYLTMVTANEPFLDLLGPIYQELAGLWRRQRSGQFFTPWSLCQMIAGMQFGDWKPGFREDGDLWSLLEPACGSGAMLLAFYSHIAQNHGPECLQFWSAVAIDIDLSCARTCALQVYSNLCLRGWAVGDLSVRHGDALTMETYSNVLNITSALIAEYRRVRALEAVA